MKTGKTKAGKFLSALQRLMPSTKKAEGVIKSPCSECKECHKTSQPYFIQPKIKGSDLLIYLERAEKNKNQLGVY